MTDPNNTPLPQVPAPGNANGAVPQPQNQNPFNTDAPATPQYGQPEYEQPQYGQQQYAQPQYNQPQYGQYGQQSQPQQTPAYGQPTQPTYEQPQYTQPTYANPYGDNQYANQYGNAPYGNAPYSDASNAQYGAPQSVPVYSTSTPAPGAAAVPLDKPYYGCSFPEAFLRFWKKYAVFSGRASRSEYWWWVLAQFGITFVLDILANVTDDKLSFLGYIWSLAIIVPGLALAVRRLHDINKPGWWIAIYYGAFVVAFILLVAGGAGALFGGLGGMAYGGTYSKGYGAIAAGSIGLLVVGVVIMLAALIVFIVFMAMPSKPEGARFDKDADPAGYAPAPAAPADAQYGQYDPQYGAPAAPTAPVPPAPGFNGPVPTPEYGTPVPQPQSYTQPAPEVPTYGSSDSSNANANTGNESSEQKPWQGQ